MQLKIIGSNSDGNCYLLEADNGETLILDCGFRFQKIKQSLDYNLSRVSGILLTHEHGDHSKGINEAINAGMNIYTSNGTAESLGLEKSHRVFPMKALKTYEIGTFKVMPFDVKHDVKEPFGFQIYHPECGLVVFITDSYYVEYQFPGTNNYIIEANYSKEIINDKVSEGFLLEYRRNRVVRSHMSIDNCIDLLLSNDLSTVNNIVLIHLSDGNSDEALFYNKVRDATHKKVFVADAGMIIENFNKTPF
ncbi:MBL fold metallo-hydrolase [Rhizosphaericola mali]|uniref:MBL fold metallo-hydrolase n=1 Tax=Rhizosphaericola mali TaxID=2545455 RepID=A0A5P2G286_9BACT|nr:MBL fold metallo-hydrolase [Rhizosphaericola mali]QES88828.1 MBL fold metallo-hydrolase [Rhizosphaericola mali]